MTTGPSSAARLAALTSRLKSRALIVVMGHHLQGRYIPTIRHSATTAPPEASPPCQAPPQAKRSDVEAEFDHVAVLHGVVAALDAGVAGGTRGRHRARRDQVVVADDLGLDEAFLEVGVDDTGRLRRRRTRRNGPRASLLRPGGQEGGKAERRESCPGELSQAGLPHAELGEQL